MGGRDISKGLKGIRPHKRLKLKQIEQVGVTNAHITPGRPNSSEYFSKKPLRTE